MELRRLDVRRLPGIERGFTLDFAPDVTLIQGPNGSGKSSVTRAILGLLFGGEDDPRHDVAGSFTAAGRAFHAERVATGRATWRAADGGRPPVLPPARSAAAYRLGLLDLHKAAASTDDQALAGEIRSRMAGGYDVPGLLAGESFKVPARLSLAGELKAANDAVNRVRAEYASVGDDERSLPDLEARLARGEQAARRQEVLALAQRLAQARARVAAAAAALAALPEELSRLRGDEAERRDRLAAAIAEEGDAIVRAEDAAERARRDLAQLGLNPAPTLDLLAEARGRLDAARADDDLLRRHEEVLAAAAAAVAERGRQLDPAWPVDRRDACTPDAIAAADGVLRRLASVAARAEATASQLAQLGPDTPPTVPAETLAEAMSHLVAWLAAPVAPAQVGRPWPALVAGGLLLLVGLGWFARGGGMMALAAAAAAVVLMVWAMMSARRPAADDDARRHAEDAFARLPVAPPAAWQRAAVLQRLREVAADLAAAREAALRQEQRRQLLAQDTRLQEERAGAEAEGRELATRCGLDPLSVEPRDVSEFLRRVAAYHEALARSEEARGQVEAVRARVQAHLADLGAALAPFGVAPAADVTAATARLGDLERRAQEHREASSRLAAQQEARESAAARLAKAEAEWANLFRALGLATGDLAALDRLLDLAPRHKQAAQEHEVAGFALREVEALVAASSASQEIGAAAARDDATRATEAADLQAAIEAAAEAREERGRVRARVDDARHGTRLQDALSALDAVQARGDRERARVHENMLARLLLEQVAAEHQAHSLPPVLARASSLFARFTGGRYELRVVREGGADAFFAVETGSARPLALGQLSDGTRAQLLLAARLAFVEDGEQGEALPLLLDEALSASDPDRFAAVAAALLEHAQADGRQLVIFTANPATIAAWQEALAAAGKQSAPVIDLAAVRGAAQAAPTNALSAPTRALVPAPDGRDAATYAQALRVPPLDALANAAGAHLYYLLGDDLATLHRILTEGAVTWGNAAALAAALGRPLAGVAPAVWQRLERRAAALDAFLVVRRVGRGRPVDVEVLRGCERVKNSTKAAEIEALLPSVLGRADRLIATLRNKGVKDVRVTLIDDLEAHLREGGYLDDRAVVSDDDLLARVIAGSRGTAAEDGWEAGELPGLVASWTRATVRPD